MVDRLRQIESSIGCHSILLLRQQADTEHSKTALEILVQWVRKEDRFVCTTRYFLSHIWVEKLSQLVSIFSSINLFVMGHVNCM